MEKEFKQKFKVVWQVSPDDYYCELVLTSYKQLCGSLAALIEFNACYVRVEIL